MDDFVKEALEIVKAQAKVRVMTEAEITSMVGALAKGLRNISGGISCEDDEASPVTAADAKKAIKEKSVTCLECGKAFKIMTKKHLLTHGLTPEEYREKYGYKKGTPLVAKGLARERRKKMTEMKLWEKRKGAGKK